MSIGIGGSRINKAATKKETNAFRQERSSEVMQAWDKALAEMGVICEVVREVG